MDERGKVVEDKENYLSSTRRTHPDVFLNVVFAYMDTALQGLAKRISPHVARSLEELFVMRWQDLRQIYPARGAQHTSKDNRAKGC